MTRRAPDLPEAVTSCKGAAVDAGQPSAQAAAIATPRKPRNHPPIGLAIGAAAAIIILEFTTPTARGKQGPVPALFGIALAARSQDGLETAIVRYFRNRPARRLDRDHRRVAV